LDCVGGIVIVSVALDALFRRGREIGPILRRLFLNTLFDSTFMQLGIIMGSAFSPDPNLHSIIGTLVSSSIALGISTGVSVYESETLERQKKLVELEKALFRSLDDTMITENYKSYAMILSLVNFFTPFVCCSIVVVPLVVAAFELTTLAVASWISIALALGILFVAGTYFGRLGKQNPVAKGLRMVLFGAIAFMIGFLVQVLI
jgi:predicted membrane protein (TIGR00267 family)